MSGNLKLEIPPPLPPRAETESFTRGGRGLNVPRDNEILNVLIVSLNHTAFYFRKKSYPDFKGYEKRFKGILKLNVSMN